MKNFYYIFIIAIINVCYLSAQTFTDQELLKMSKPAKRDLFFRQQRAYPFEKIPDGARIKAIKQSDELLYNKKSNAVLLAQQPEWRCVGPFNIGGRVRSVVHHPTKQNIVYIGAAAGGVWKTTDGGTSWKPLFDGQNSLSFGALAIDPNNPDIIFAATGENSQNVDSYLGSGVYKSTDAGETWKEIGMTHVGGFSKIYVHPLNSDFVFAGATKGGKGFWKSTDGGKTWRNTNEVSVTDVTFNPNNTKDIYIGVHGSGVYYSSDAGETWEDMNIGFNANIGRVSVQLARSNPKIMYALMENGVNIGGTNYNQGMIYKSTNGGVIWNLVFNGGNQFFGAAQGRESGQGWYDNFIEVHPNNENIVFAGGIYLFRTLNGGANWSMQMYLSGGSGDVHVDQHTLCFNPISPSEIYLGNDGGMYRSNNGGDSWININNNLPITQFYAMAIDNSKRNRNYGGTQDNGSLGNFSNQDYWSYVNGGDGFRMIVQPDNPDIIYGEYPNGQIWKRNLSGNPQTKTKGIPSDDEGLWNTPLIMDPNNSFVLYTGRSAIYATYDYADNWTQISERRSSGKYTAIDVSPANEEIIYAGNNAGELFVTTDAGTTWKLLANKGLPARYITDITASYKSDNIAYITFSGFGSPHVYKTTDLGNTWKDISGGLPDVPCNAIVIHPDNEKILAVATDIGVFASFDDGGTWFPYGRGLPRSPVVDLAFHTNRVILPDIVLRAATHGRSMWEVDFSTESIAEPEITVPGGGEIYISTTRQKIVWYGFDLPVKVERSFDNGETWTTVSESVNSNEMNWTIPSSGTVNARIKVSSLNNSSQVKISHPFTIQPLKRGSVLMSTRVFHTPYGIAFDGKNSVWTTSFYSGKMYKHNKNDLIIQKEIDPPGDSLFTDLTIDKNKQIIYVHRMHSTSAGGGVILVMDTSGNVMKQYDSPATDYPIGLELVDGKLIVSDRDRRRIYEMNPETGAVISNRQNPSQARYGPRGIGYDGEEFLFEVVTEFPTDAGLTDAYVIKFSKYDLTKEVDRISLADRNGLINGRGVEYDPSDKNLWITSFGGDIYKIAGFDTKPGAVVIQSFDIDMGKISVGNSKDSTITAFVKNLSDEPVTINDLRITGSNAADFTIISAPPPYTIPSEGSIDIGFRFTPSATGIRTAKIEIVTESSELIQDIRGEGIEPTGYRTAQKGFPETISSAIYPNPMQDFTNISFTTGRSANLKIELYDIFGTRLAELFDGLIEEGSHNVVQYQGKNLASGIYNIVFYINGQRAKVEKLVVVK